MGPSQCEITNQMKMDGEEKILDFFNRIGIN
jgi:hypothetical protein